MKLSVCTISFRHHLTSIGALARWAKSEGFDGIELWGPHARNLALRTSYDAEWLRSIGLEVSMLSDYLPLDAAPAELARKVKLLSELAKRWGTKKIRTFAGDVASAGVPSERRRRIVSGLRTACELLQRDELRLLVETHPNTLADTLASTERLLGEVDHSRLWLNFDVLHLWEAGDDPRTALSVLRSRVAHYHLKNVKARRLLHTFAPANVYSPAGARDAMVSLFEGAFDYRPFLESLAGDDGAEASLEWFGDDVERTLSRDRASIAELFSARRFGARPRRTSLGGSRTH